MEKKNTNETIIIINCPHCGEQIEHSINVARIHGRLLGSTRSEKKTAALQVNAAKARAAKAAKAAEKKAASEGKGSK
ncbi:hypothetical protein [Geotalea sp. SG265]|uniref:hypothetical protein n=1 Tax=Geotalea sp. SG265 TaxID=2922867 RepID=UPI001FB03D74|nr:hypothetical protein [Geotalea sp. SG265]